MQTIIAAICLTLLLALNAQVKCVPVEKYLLDSTKFQGELNWDKAAYGDSNELPGWKEQSFSQKNGDVWRVHFVCDIASSNPNNWLRLPYLAREEANRLSIKLEYTIRECKKYPGEIRSCKETFQLLYMESDGEEEYERIRINSNRTIDEEPITFQFQESKFKYLKTIAPNSASSSSQDGEFTTASSTKSTTTMSSSSSSSSSPIFRTEVDLPLNGNKKGVYIVFRDQGACVSLLSIKVYYTLCSMQIFNLVVFPKTPTGSNVTDLVQQVGHCVENAEAKIKPYAYCQTNGNWFITNDNGEKNVCICRAGYYQDMEKSQCLACPQGKYKLEASNEQECKYCPINSWSESIGETRCECKDGYYRLNVAEYDAPCIPYPPEPKNLTVYYLDQTSIKLRWDPISNYEQSMVQYKLECFKCVEHANKKEFISTEIIRRNSLCSERVLCENYVQIVPKKEEIFENKVSLNSLDSNAQYLIEIFAQHVRGLFKTKTVDIMVRTFDDLKELEIKNLTAYQFTDMNQILLVWSDPLSLLNNSPFKSTTNSANNLFITGSTIKINNPNLFLFYEIRYWPKDNPLNANIITIKAPAQNFTFKNSNPNVISNNLYVFQIRGQNAKGWGPYSSPIESLKISNSYLKSNISSAVKFNFYSTVFTKEASSLNFDQLKILTSTSSQITSFSQSESISIYVAVAISSSLCFIIGTLTVLVLLTRSGRIKFLSTYLSKPANNAGNSGSSSECDSIDIAKRNAKMAYNQLGPHSAGTTSSGDSSPIWPPLNAGKTYISPHTYEDPTRVVSLFAKELAPSNIIIESVIGGGEFGDVCKGYLKNNPWSETIVAIKTLKGAATEQNRCDFLTEASIMAQFNDPNVVRLEGVVTTSLPLMIVTEYMENGSLDTFLRLNETKLKLPQMIKILRDVASGMRYLSDMNYIHRDLAARNILVNKDMVCKVADFGLSREIEGDAYEYTTKGGKIPIRWTAPEACTFRKYSCASDVWSFGIFMWEVLSLGERPYWNWENKDVIQAVQEFYRLPPPRNCPDCLYKLMQRCWQDDRSLRPKFPEIVLILDEMFHFPEETKKLTKIREVNPINPRQPTKIQLTSTKQFLSRLNLDQYLDNFQRCGLSNLSNLFQLEPKDLSYSLGIHSQYDQKKIIDELKSISISFNQILGQPQNQNSYQQVAMNNLNRHSSTLNPNDVKVINNFNTCLKTLKLNQEQQQKQSSIFHLIRNKNENVNNQINNDLLLFSNTQMSTLAQNFTNGGGGADESSGYFV